MILLVTLFAEAILFAFIASANDDDRAYLRRRMGGYAFLKEAPSDAQQAQAKCRTPHIEHEVLLGMAKKVEAKAVSLLTIWVLVCSGTLAAIPLVDPHDRVYGLIFLAASAPILFALVRLFRQIDNKDARRYGFEPRQLQRVIREDLLQKEACFRFSYRMTQIAAMLFFATAVWSVLCYDAGNKQNFVVLRIVLRLVG